MNNRWKEKWRNKTYEWINTIVSALIIALIIKTFIIQAFKIPSESMVPTFQIGDHLFALKFKYGIPIPFTEQRFPDTWEPKRGEVIIFKYPEDTTKDYIKRVIGLPGEEVLIRNKQVYINNSLLKESYPIHTDPRVFSSNENRRDNWDYSFKVPSNSYFVMGDNRDYSCDSRFWGTVPRKLIKGSALLIYWPPLRCRLIK